MGWGYIQGDGSSNRLAETVTFPAAFGSPPIVVTSYAGATGSVPSDITDFTSSGAATTRRAAGQHSISSSSFSAIINDNNALASSVYYAYTWIAIGPA